jgi:hypothetical protein
MPLPLIPIAIVGLAALAYRQRGKRDASSIGVDPSNTTVNTGAMTPERQVVYEEFMAHESDPEKLAKMAFTFQQQGLPLQATMMRKKAALRNLPETLKAKREEKFREIMASKDKAFVLRAADTFFREGCWGAAQSLRDYGEGLE